MNFHAHPSMEPYAKQDEARLHEISRLGLISSSVNPSLKRAVDTAAREFNVPIALVSVVLDDAQYFAAMHGIEGWMEQARGTPLEWSFCLNAVRSRKPFIVSDASDDRRVSENPLVQIDGIRSYAGAPLITKNGHAVGAFCVIGAEARQFSACEIARLEGFARRVVEELENEAK